jgi:hypothetical protein
VTKNLPSGYLPAQKNLVKVDLQRSKFNLQVQAYCGFSQLKIKITLKQELNTPAQVPHPQPSLRENMGKIFDLKIIRFRIHLTDVVG